MASEHAPKPSIIATISGEAGRAVKVEVVGRDYTEVRVSVGNEIRRSDLGRQLVGASTIQLRRDGLLKFIAKLQKALEVVEAGRTPNDLARIYDGRAR